MVTFGKETFDITVTQLGTVYTVSGPGAAALHAKMQEIPPEARNLKVGELKDGAFTLEKIALPGSEQQPANANARVKEAAKA